MPSAKMLSQASSDKAEVGGPADIVDAHDATEEIHMFGLPANERLMMQASCDLKVEDNGRRSSFDTSAAPSGGGSGTMYIFKNYICFGETKKGDWKYTRKLSEITSMEKAVTHVVLPNAIVLLTEEHRLLFSGFKSRIRDQAFSLLQNMWKVSISMEEITGPCPDPAPPLAEPQVDPAPSAEESGAQGDGQGSGEGNSPKKGKEAKSPTNKTKSDPDQTASGLGSAPAVPSSSPSSRFPVFADALQGDHRAQTIIVLLCAICFILIWLMYILHRLALLQETIRTNSGTTHQKCLSETSAITTDVSFNVGKELHQMQQVLQRLQEYFPVKE
jgi:hypothetical protein